MALILSRTLSTALGLNIQLTGNIGGITFREIPLRGVSASRECIRGGTPTAAQAEHRAKFAAAYVEWRALTPLEQEHWRLAANRIHSRQIAPHLFVRCWWRRDQYFVSVIKLHYNIDLILPEM